ncbi:MAG: Ger(x)C family spore germination C-terminal domain-containing protein [Clostridia bacterium]
MNSYIGKEVNLSHCKILVFSEKIASQGISNEIYSLINNVQIRPSTNIIISKCEAKIYIENSKPSLENLLTKYYEIFPNSSLYTGYTSNSTIGEFFNRMTCHTCEPNAILGGLIENADEQLYASSSNPQDSTLIKSNETSISGKRGAENIGLAIFKEDTLVGELNAMETVCFSIVRNDINGFLITVPDPEQENSYIDIYLYPNQSTSNTVKIINGTPYITVSTKLKGRIYSMKRNSKYLDSAVLDRISAQVNHYLEASISAYLYRTAKELKSDVNGFGKKALINFATTQEFENYDWLSNYENSFFNVQVDSNIQSGFLLTET